VLRHDLGRLMAALTHRLGSFQRTEDALQEASLSALSHSAHDGLPQSPQGWLIRVAFRKALDQLRAEGRDGEREAAVQLVNELLGQDEPEPIPDERLRMIFTCCHPALEPKSRVALTLRTVCAPSATCPPAKLSCTCSPTAGECSLRPGKPERFPTLLACLQVEQVKLPRSMNSTQRLHKAGQVKSKEMPMQVNRVAQVIDLEPFESEPLYSCFLRQFHHGFGQASGTHNIPDEPENKHHGAGFRHQFLATAIRTSIFRQQLWLLCLFFHPQPFAQ
jgi:hypothetical protein